MSFERIVTLAGRKFKREEADDVVKYHSIGDEKLSLETNKAAKALGGEWETDKSISYFLGRVNRYIEERDPVVEPNNVELMMVIKSAATEKMESLPIGIYQYSVPLTPMDLVEGGHLDYDESKGVLNLLKLNSPAGTFTYMNFEGMQKVVGAEFPFDDINWRIRAARYANLLNFTSSLKVGQGEEVVREVMKIDFSREL